MPIVVLVLVLIANTLCAQEILTRPQAKIVEECLVDNLGNRICDGCEAWWGGQEPKDLRRVGWTVDRVEVTAATNKTYPRWRVCIGDECGFIEHTKQFKTELQRYLDRRAARRK